MLVDYAALRRKTAPRLLCERAREAPHALAFRSKHLGIYRERSWRAYAGLVARLDQQGYDTSRLHRLGHSQVLVGQPVFSVPGVPAAMSMN